MSEPVASASVVPISAGPPLRLLWVRRPRTAPALGGFHAAPGGLVEPADAGAPNDGGEAITARVAGLRELFEEVGLLLAHGAERLSEAERGELRDRLREDAAEGQARLREAGLVWRTAELEPIGRWITPEHASPRFDTHFFALRMAHPVEPDLDLLELDEAEWIEPAAALRRWQRARVVLAPPLYELLRSLDRHGELRASDLRAAYGAAGQPSVRWEVVPWVQLMPLRTPTLPPATHTNAFLVGSGEAVLIEPASPYPEEVERAVAWVEEARRAGITPRAILLTHHHVDHVGGARALSERLGLPLWGHRQTGRRLPRPLRLQRTLEDGDRLELDGPEPVALRVLHTPGHAPGHLCFLEERSGVMIAGDMVAEIGTILVEPKDGDMRLYLESLRRMAELEPTALLPAHGSPLYEPRRVLEGYIQHRLGREERVYASLVAHGGAAAPADLVPAAYDDAPRAVWPLAALSTEAHLIKLEADGRARRSAEGWHPTQA